jgi:hypothetical protein
VLGLRGCERAGRPSGEFVGEVPGPQVTRFEANEEVVGSAVGICGSGLRAEVARCDSLDCVLDSGGEELGAAAELDSPVRRGSARTPRCLLLDLAADAPPSRCGC